MAGGGDADDGRPEVLRHDTERRDREPCCEERHGREAGARPGPAAAEEEPRQPAAEDASEVGGQVDDEQRFLPYWHQTIVPDLRAGKRVLIAAHGNSLRALVQYLDDLSEEEIVKLNIPTGIPLVYELDDSLKPLRNYYLGDPEAARRAAG